jgi:hypothetical protein
VRRARPRTQPLLPRPARGPPRASHAPRATGPRARACTRGAAAHPLRAPQATFEAGVKGLLLLAQSGAAPPAALLPAAARTHALLKARYSNPAWLRLGAALFAACLAPPLEPAARAKLEGYAADVRALLGDEADGAEPAAPREPTLGELLGFPAPQVGWGAAGVEGEGAAAAAAVPARPSSPHS